MIKTLQRGIISGLISETFNKDEVKKRFEICEKIIPKYKDCFEPKQLQILRIIYAYAKKYSFNKDAYFGLSDVCEKIIFQKYPYLQEEINEILSTGAITEEVIPVYLTELENQMLEV